MSVVLSGETEERINEILQSGRFATAEQVVSEGLRLLALERFRSELRERIAEAERGEATDGEAFMAQMIAELDAEIEAEEQSRP